MSPASPQPPSGQTQPRRDEQDGKDDLFATLFSPPTPPASPFPALALGNTTVASCTKPHPPMQSRRFSTSSNEFGSFVSVSATEDPLYASPQPMFPSIPPQNGLQFFDQFTDHAAKSNAQKRQVLDELLLHQDDPLYWVNELNEFSPPDPDALEADTQHIRPPHLSVPPIPEEPSSPDHQETGQQSDRYASKFSKPNTP